jgi:hypothetical protein
MRVLLDECVPKQLGRHLPGHKTRTAAQMAWSGLKNGRLINAMVGDGFEVMLTVDRGIPFQQNIKSLPIGIIVMAAPSNDIDDLTLLVPEMMTALASILPGQIVIVVNAP